MYICYSDNYDENRDIITIIYFPCMCCLLSLWLFLFCHHLHNQSCCQILEFLYKTYKKVLESLNSKHKLFIWSKKRVQWQGRKKCRRMHTLCDSKIYHVTVIFTSLFESKSQNVLVDKICSCLSNMAAINCFHTELHAVGLSGQCRRTLRAATNMYVHVVTQRSNQL